MKNRHVQINKRKKRKTQVWLSGRLHIEGRLNEGQRLQRKHKDENKAQQNKGNNRERRHGICKPNVRRIQVRATSLWLVHKGERTSTSPLTLGYPLLAMTSLSAVLYCTRHCFYFYAGMYGGTFCSCNPTPSRFRTYVVVVCTYVCCIRFKVHINEDLNVMTSIFSSALTRGC